MTYKDAERRVQDGYHSTLETGAVTPASSIMGPLNFILLIGWLMICPSVSNSTYQKTRLSVFICIAYVSLWNLMYTRSLGVVGSIGVGLNSVLCIVMAVNFILLHDPRFFKRAILTPVVKDIPANKPAINLQQSIADDEQKKLNITWEPMPQFGRRRMFWVLDLISGLRGVHWAWKSSPLPNFTSSSSPLRPRHGLNALLSNNIIRFLADVILFDAVKCSMIADPFFIHYPTRAPPPHIASYISSPLGIYLYRMLLATAGGFIAIDMIFTFGMLVQVNILGTGIIGLNAETGTFPPLWGSPNAVLDRGLRGFWGETWHQMLRMHYLTLGDALAYFVLGDKRSDSAKFQVGTNLRMRELRTAIRVWTVFLLSGALHAAASYTLLGPTKPWCSFLFFALQPLGIVIQNTVSKHAFVIYPSFLPGGWKEIIGRIANLGFVFGWLAVCSPLMLNDLTSGGIWMFEPLPVSLLRGLGFSTEERSFWCW